MCQSLVTVCDFVSAAKPLVGFPWNGVCRSESKGEVRPVTCLEGTEGEERCRMYRGT